MGGEIWGHRTNYQLPMKSSPAETGATADWLLSSFQRCNGAASLPGLAVSGWATCLKELVLPGSLGEGLLFYSTVVTNAEAHISGSLVIMGKPRCLAVAAINRS
jgi:hypothetical protein